MIQRRFGNQQLLAVALIILCSFTAYWVLSVKFSPSARLRVTEVDEGGLDSKIDQQLPIQKTIQLRLTSTEYTTTVITSTTTATIQSTPTANPSQENNDTEIGNKSKIKSTEFSLYAPATSYEAEHIGPNLPWKQVCIVGNTQKRAGAIRSHLTWNSKFPSFWYVWGEDPKASDPDLPHGIFLVNSEDKKTWAQGILFVVNQARRTFDCEYIFTHDDDLEFHVKDENDQRSLSLILSQTLLRHQPAVAGFPWAVGDKSYAAMADLKDMFNTSAVAPLTGFDSGMLLYHKSVVDFFVPYSPRGEGGFYGNWSLCAHFINLFAPMVFRGGALRINTITYQNLINIDNVPYKERKRATFDDKGLAIHSESRHPYEYKFNTPYKRFLSNGLLNRQQRWGRELAPYDLTWDIDIVDTTSISVVVQNYPIDHRTFNRWTVLDQLASFYDLTHPILSKNMWLKTRFTSYELLEYMKNRSKLGADFRIVIHIFTMNRFKSFNRLWQSINSSNIINRPVSISIHVDNDESADREVYLNFIKHLRGLSSKHGRVTVSFNTHHKGLRDSIMDAWIPTDRNEYAIFLEDDLSVSPHFLEYADQMITKYLNSRGSTSYNWNCIGISMYNQRYDEVNDKYWHIDTGDSFAPYLLQMPQSWGAIYSPDGWAEFLKWYMTLPENFNPLVPNSMTNRWPPERSWKKFLIRYMAMKGKFMIYPNLPGGMSLSTNHVEPGTNDRSKGAAMEEIRQRFNVPLLKLDKLTNQDEALYGGPVGREFYERVTQATKQGSKLKLLTMADERKERKDELPFVFGTNYLDLIDLMDNVTFQQSPVKALSPGLTLVDTDILPAIGKLKIINTNFKVATSIGSLAIGNKATSFDKCTLVLQVYSRTKTVLDRVKFYHTFPLLSSIVIVWNNLNVEPPMVISPLNSAEAKKSKKLSKLPHFNIPIHFLKQDKNSINNRYKPFPEVGTDCVISMDDDWDMPHEHLRQAIKLFQGHFYDNIIGFRHQARTHVRGKNDGEWVYVAENKHNASIVLPSGAVFHRKYLNMYTNVLPQEARDKVDELMNGEDILFNMMVSNATKAGPVVLDLWAKAIDMGGLWHDPHHFSERCNVLTYFANEIFGGQMPLRYTQSFFKDGSTSRRMFNHMSGN